MTMNRKKKFKTLSVQFKIILPIMLVVGTIICSMVYYIFLQVHDETDAQGIAMAKIIRIGAELASNNPNSGIEAYLKELHQQLGNELLFSAILNKDTSPVYTTDNNYMGTTTLQTFVKANQDSKEWVLQDTTYKSEAANLLATTLSNGQILVLITSENVLHTIRNVTLVVVTISMVLLLVCIYWIVYRQFETLRTLEKMMSTISEGQGDLTQRLVVKSEDEIGRVANSFNQFIEKIQSIIAQVQQTATATSVHTKNVYDTSIHNMTVSKEIDYAIQSITKATASQYDEIEQGTISIRKIATVIENTDQHAQHLEKLSTLIGQRQQSGEQAVIYLQNHMQSFASLSDQVSVNLNHLITEVNGIVNMSVLIQEISKQTGLLALNASIEAARAGEHGKGFAVVASEVGKLSDQSKEATTQIQDILNRIISSTTLTKEVMNASQIALNDQSQSVDNTSGAFIEIGQSIQEMNSLIVSMKDMTTQLNISKEHIIDFIQSASTTTEETAAGSQEVLASVENQIKMSQQVTDNIGLLTENIKELNVMVDRFKV